MYNNLNFISKTNLIFISLFLLFTGNLAHASSTSKDLYVFFINGDGDYPTTICSNGEDNCHPKYYMNADASQVFLNRAQKLAQECKNCDAMIIYIKEERKKGKRAGPYGSSSSYSYKIDKTTSFYRDGQKIKEKQVDGLSDVPFVPIPVLGKITAFLQKTEFSGDISAFKRLFPNTTYRHQIAFAFGHKIPDKPQKGYFPSNQTITFSIENFSNALKNLSSQINNKKDRPFDALFLAQCLSTINTIHTISKTKAVNLVLASPEIVPFNGLIDWDLDSLHRKLDSSENAKEGIQTWLQNIFTPDTEESLTNSIFSPYTLSLFDMKALSHIEDDFNKAILELKKTKSKRDEETRKKTANQASGIERKQIDKTNLLIEPPIFDCQKLEFMEDFLIKSASSVTRHSLRPLSALEIIMSSHNPTSFTKKEKAPHSGWSCL